MLFAFGTRKIAGSKIRCGNFGQSSLCATPREIGAKTERKPEVGSQKPEDEKPEEEFVLSWLLTSGF